MKKVLIVVIGIVALLVVVGASGAFYIVDETQQVLILQFGQPRGDPDTTAKLVETLITEDEVDFLLGPYSSGLTKSASAISEKYDKIMDSATPNDISKTLRQVRELKSQARKAGYDVSTLK